MSPWMDIAAVSIPLGQAIGRFANYVNQELYGAPTNLPWGIQIPRDARVAPYESLIDYPVDSLFHPIWAYEAIWSLVAFYVFVARLPCVSRPSAQRGCSLALHRAIFLRAFLARIPSG